MATRWISAFIEVHMSTCGANGAPLIHGARCGLHATKSSDVARTPMVTAQPDAPRVGSLLLAVALVGVVLLLAQNTWNSAANFHRGQTQRW